MPGKAQSKTMERLRESSKPYRAEKRREVRNQRKQAVQKNTARRKQTKRKLYKSHQRVQPAQTDKNRGGWTPSKLSLVTAGDKRLARGSLLGQYLRCIVNNSMYTSRFPDSAKFESATFTSTSVFQLPILVDVGDSVGRFSCCLQPIIGATNLPTSYQAAIATVQSKNYGAPGQLAPVVDWSSASSYAPLVGNRDPRLDPNYRFLVAPDTSGWAASTVFTAVGAALAQPASLTVGTQNFTGQVPGGNATTTLSPLLTGLGVLQNTDGTLTLPTGTFLINMSITATNNSGGILTNVVPNALFPATGTTTLDQQQTLAVSTANGGTLQASNQYLVTLSVPTAIGFTITKTASPTRIASGDLNTLTTKVTITAASTPGQPNAVGGGAIQTIRPVAMTAWCYWFGPDIRNGGLVTGLYTTKQSSINNYFTSDPASGLGRMQVQENLAQMRNAWTSKINMGTYQWWSPQDNSDWEYRTIPNMNAAEYPSFIISGIYDIEDIPTGPTTNYVMEVKLCITYEFTTLSTAFEQKYMNGSQAIIDHAQNLLTGQPHTMPNGKHLDWIDKMINLAGKVAPIALPLLL